MPKKSGTAAMARLESFPPFQGDGSGRAERSAAMKLAVAEKHM